MGNTNKILVELKQAGKSLSIARKWIKQDVRDGMVSVRLKSATDNLKYADVYIDTESRLGYMLKTAHDSAFRARYLTDRLKLYRKTNPSNYKKQVARRNESVNESVMAIAKCIALVKRKDPIGVRNPKSFVIKSAMKRRDPERVFKKMLPAVAKLRSRKIDERSRRLILALRRAVASGYGKVQLSDAWEELKGTGWNITARSIVEYLMEALAALDGLKSGKGDFDKHNDYYQSSMKRAEGSIKKLISEIQAAKSPRKSLVIKAALKRGVPAKAGSAMTKKLAIQELHNLRASARSARRAVPDTPTGITRFGPSGQKPAQERVSVWLDKMRTSVKVLSRQKKFFVPSPGKGATYFIERELEKAEKMLGSGKYGTLMGVFNIIETYANDGIDSLKRWGHD